MSESDSSFNSSVIMEFGGWHISGNMGLLLIVCEFCCVSLERQLDLSAGMLGYGIICEWSYMGGYIPQSLIALTPQLTLVVCKIINYQHITPSKNE